MKSKRTNNSRYDQREVYVSVDIEASGPIPAEYSMLSLGACLVHNTAKTFYVELKPINTNYVKEALEVCGLSMEYLMQHGTEPDIAVKQFDQWVRTIEGRPVFVGFNTPFDWSFVNYYFYKYVGNNPFGHNALDIKAYWMGLRKTKWYQTSKQRIPAYLKSKLKHNHNALQDSIEQADLFANLLSVRKYLRRTRSQAKRKGA